MDKLGKRFDAARNHHIKLVVCVSGAPFTPDELGQLSLRVTGVIQDITSGEFVSLGLTQELDVNGEDI